MNRVFVAVIGALVLVSQVTRTAEAQPVARGGLDLTLGPVVSSGGEYQDRNGMSFLLELFLPATESPGRSTWMLALQVAYMNFEGVDDRCPSPPGSCLNSFPDLTSVHVGMGMQHMITSRAFVQGNALAGFVTTSIDGGPALGIQGVAQAGYFIVPRFALVAGGRALYMPDMRASPIGINNFTVGVRYR